METKFQTSFIPKRPLPATGMPGVGAGVPLNKRSAHAGSLFLNLSVLIFILSIGAGAIVYAWKIVLENNLNSYKKQLADKQSQVDPTLIQTLRVVNARIDLAKALLEKHAAVSSVFDIVGRMTAESVRFVSMEVTTPTAANNNSPTPPVGANPNIVLTLNGLGLNLSTVAFQAQVLTELEKYGLKEIIRNPILSDPNIENDGSVTFKLKEEVDPSTIIYMKGSSNPNP